MIGRVWFIQAPGTASLLQRPQVGVGLVVQSDAPPVPTSLLAYLRRYMNDVPEVS